MNALLAALVGMACAAPAFAQLPKKAEPRQGMRHEERQRLREDMREVYRDRNADRGRPQQPPPRQMSQEDREKLRRDVEEANRNIRR